MKKRLIKYFLLLFIFTYSAEAQNSLGSVYGKVVDAVTGQPLIGTNILVIGTDRGAAADVNGEYEITNLPPATYRIRASSIGYETVTITDVNVNTSRPTNLIFELKSSAIELDSVTVTAGYFNKDLLNVVSTKKFSYEEIRRAPGGFEDVVRALSILPGVAQADPGRNDLIVRGGAPSENLYVVDGIEIPNINHFGTQGATGGPLSYINLDFVKETSFSTGGFSVMYGDKLSSVLNIKLRDGRNDRIGGKATISASQFGLDLEGPIGENNNFIFSVRRSYLDFIFKAAGFGFVPEYYDALSKLNFKIDDRNSISFLFIGAFDNVKFFNETADQRFDNSGVLGSDQIQYVTGINYKSLFDKGFFNLSLNRNYTDFDSSQKDSLLNPVYLNKSAEAENTLKGDFVYQFNPNYEINIGASGKLIKFKTDILFPPFTTTFGDTLSINNLSEEKYFTKFAGYINFNTFQFDRIILNLGLRADYFNAIEDEFYLSPRFSASYKINELLNLNFSTGIYRQSPSYLWLAASENNKKLKSIRTDHYILGLEYLFREDALLKVETFYKNYQDYPASLLRPYLVLANTGAGFGDAENNFSSLGLEPLASIGKGRSKGIEISAQKKLSDVPFYGLVSFTYSETEFAGADEIFRPGSYDQNILFNLSGGYKIDAHWEFSLKFRYSSGQPYTPYNSDGTQNVAEYNSTRLEPNHSLDVRVDRRWFFENITLITYIDVQNVYNRKNSNYVKWDERTGESDKESSIGILPSIGISLEF